MSIKKGSKTLAGTVVYREVGQIIQSTIPLKDKGLHLLDGSLISGSGIYKNFVNYIAGLVPTYSSLFVSEANWQSAVSTYGVCGKFVYDSVNNTVRLPKYNSKIYTGGGEAQVKGNGIALGLTDGTNNAGLYNNSNGILVPPQTAYGVNLGSSVASGGSLTSAKPVGITTDGSKSGIITDLSNITTALDGYYYIVIASSITNNLSIDVADVMDSKANLNLSNSTAITNCITYIPQDIKLELNNGTLTLKAGSKVYVPNGFESDGTTPKFIEDIVIGDDPIYVPTNGECFVYRNSNADGTSYLLANFTSGTTAPTSNFIIWYDITNNLIKRYSGGTFQDSGSSLPIAKITTANGSVVSIDQVFNGFGYIGSIVFALPGVKGLIPNGRNDDGSLKNIEFTIDTVKTATRTWIDNDSLQVWGYVKNPPTGVGETWYWNAYIESNEEPSRNEYTMWYKPSENITYVNNGAQSSTPNWEKVNYIDFGKASGIKSQEIKIFTPKTAFHALDYNDSSTISGWSMPSTKYIDLTIGANGSFYTAPANGWFIFQSGVNSGGYLGLRNTTTSLCFEVRYSAPTNGKTFVPVCKNDVIEIGYENLLTTNKLFRFVYAEGEE